MHFARRAFALVAPLIIVPSLLAAQTYPSKDDPRSKLRPGRFDGDSAAKNMRLVSLSKKPSSSGQIRSSATGAPVSLSRTASRKLVASRARS